MNDWRDDYDSGDDMARVVRIVVAMLLVLVLAYLAWTTSVRAHEAPAGWSYPFQCCSGYDCREVDGPHADVRKSAVQIQFDEERGEYVVSTTGERIGQLGVDARTKSSPDGAFHWCSKKGADDTATICLFVPPRLF